MLHIHKKSLFLFMLTLLLLLIGCQDTKKEDKIRNDIAGRWTGAIQVPNQPLEIEVTFSEDNEWNGVITIPIQGVEDYPFKKVDVSQGDITFTMEMNGQLLTFEGEIKDAEMKGSFTQQGQTFPFELKKGEQTSEKEGEEEGQFLSIETDYGTLYGELAIPENDGPFPVVLIIPGSGPTDRNGNSPGITNNSLKMVAKELAENGVASLRYDKRGAGKNQLTDIKEEDLDFNQFVEDATLWVKALKEDERFTDVGIIGHSQGSLEGMLAAQKADVDLYISIAGAGRTIDHILHDQLKDQLPPALLKESDEIMQKLKEGEQVTKVSPELDSLFRTSAQPFLTSWMSYDPTKEIRKLKMPVMIINGTHDVQVNVHEAERLNEAKSDAKLLLVDKMNHILKEAPDNYEENIATYSNPDLPLADGLMNGIITFLKENHFIGS